MQEEEEEREEEEGGFEDRRRRKAGGEHFEREGFFSCSGLSLSLSLSLSVVVQEETGVVSFPECNQAKQVEFEA